MIDTDLPSAGDHYAGDRIPRGIALRDGLSSNTAAIEASPGHRFAVPEAVLLVTRVPELSKVMFPPMASTVELAHTAPFC